MTTSNRTAVRARIVELLTDTAPSGVAVYHGQPAQWPNEGIVVGPTSGSSEVKLMQAGRKRRNDTFTITIFCWSSVPGQDAITAESRCEEFLAVVDDALADNATLGVEGVKWATLNQVDGPDSEGTDEGWIAYGTITIEVHSELS